MLRKLLQFTRHFPIQSITGTIIFSLVLFNLLAYRHAQAMLHFAPGGDRTAKPEALTTWQKVAVLLTGVNIPKPKNDTTPDELGLEYETHRYRVNNDVELEAWYIPHPQPKGIVLMFHAYAVSKSSLLPEAQAFNEIGYDTFLVDFRGSGGSNQSETSIGFYEAEDVAASVEYVQSKLGKGNIVLYGQSMGGAAILRAVAEEGVRPQGVIIEAVFDRMLSTVANRFVSMGVPPFPNAQVLIFWGGMINGHSGFKHNPIDYAGRVECPVLMLHGTADERATLAQAEAVFEQIRSQKRLETFEGVGHESYLEAEPEQWKGVIRQFLSQQVR
jgi:alpha-beta hydrolase superfamily lysophospholipase